MRGVCAFFMLLVSIAVQAQKFSSELFSDELKTLVVCRNGDDLQDPVIRLGSDEFVHIGFDLMSKQPRDYSYRIFHCNADWTKTSTLTRMDYMQGFEDNPIEEYESSFNTTFDYTHYSLAIPNENVQLLLSGNYVVQIFETDAPDKVVATACFSLSEDKLALEGEVSPNTVHGVKTKYQQVNFEIDCSQFAVTAPQEELKILVQQNGRTDNQVFGVEPTYIQPTKLVFEDNKKLVFEAGKEFEKIDFSHIRNFSGAIETIKFHHPYYHVDVVPGEDRTRKEYYHSEDVDGRFKIHGQSIWTDKEIDYSVVHFTFPAEEPWLDGALYVGGYLNGNRLDKNNKMQYSFERKQYELTMVLKNGGYNFQYLFLPAGLKCATLSRTSGSCWETENEYKIYVYFRSLGGQYDRLVAVRNLFFNK